MSGNQTSSSKVALVRELLAAIQANWPVARGSGGCSAEPSFRGDWLVMDRDGAERVRKAAVALRQSANDNAVSGAGERSSEALVQELLTAIEANKPMATGTGHCPDVPCFDRHDREAERNRPGWELVYKDKADRITKAAAVLSEALRDRL